MSPRAPSSSLFPYTTLFRSGLVLEAVFSAGGAADTNGIAALLRLQVACTGKRSNAAIPFVDRKSTRLNSSHRCISYAVFCLKKKTDSVERWPAVGVDYAVAR